MNILMDGRLIEKNKRESKNKICSFFARFMFFYKLWKSGTFDIYLQKDCVHCSVGRLNKVVIHDYIIEYCYDCGKVVTQNISLKGVLNSKVCFDKHSQKHS